MGEEHRLRVLREICEAGRERVIGELQILYCSPDIISVMRWVGHVARMFFGRETGRKER